MVEKEYQGVKSKEEVRPAGAKYILIRGLEDLGEGASKLLGKAFGVTIFNPKWRSEESLADKIVRLDEEVESAKKDGQEVIFIGLSAGGGLSKTYDMVHPDKVRYFYHVSGTLNPDLNNTDPDFKSKMEALTKSSPGFAQMARFLTDHQDRGEVTSHKVTAYYSTEDETVPNNASVPPKANKVKEVGGNHLFSIVRAIFQDVKPQMKLQKGMRLG